MSQHLQHVHYRQKKIWLWRGAFLGTLVAGFIFLQCSWVLADEVWAEYSITSVGGFLTTSGEKTVPAYWPTEPGEVSSKKVFSFYALDGNIGVGMRRHAVSTFAYSAGAAQFAYYQLLEKELPATITGIDSTVTMYNREDYWIDLCLERGKFRLTTGYQLMLGTDLFRCDLARGSATPTPDKMIPYHLQADYAMWKGYTGDIGHGDSWRLALDYQWNDNITVHVLGDDLFGELYWQKIDEYHGTLSTEMVYVDENGQTVVRAPMEGVYLANGLLKIEQPARWRGEIRYKRTWGELRNWVQYQEGWEFGVKGTVMPRSLPHLGVGVLRRGQSWQYEIGVGRPEVQIGVIVRTGVTRGYHVNLRVNLM